MLVDEGRVSPPVMRNVIFEAIERALAAFEIADYLYVSEFGKLNMLQAA